MNIFSVRVLLHDADWSEYVTLRERLAEIGVVDQIKGDAGIWYELPPAEYTVRSDLTVEEVRDEVRTVAAQIKAKPAVLVTKSAGRAWSGLKRATSKRGLLSPTN